jgi:hypothetical protein
VYSPQKHRGLPPELRERLDRCKRPPNAEREERTPGIHEKDLDAILAELDVKRFERQLQALIVELGDTRLVSDRKPAQSHKIPGLPTGGISRTYLKEVEHFSTMDRADEVVLARRMEFVTARLEAAEYQSRSIQSARRAEYLRVRAEFVDRSLHLVVSEAYSYRTYGVPMDDLIQEGNTALMRAVEKFDWRHQVRFRTYVAYWIRQARYAYRITCSRSSAGSSAKASSPAARTAISPHGRWPRRSRSRRNSRRICWSPRGRASRSTRR